MERTVAARRIEQLAGQMRAQLVDDRAGEIARRADEIGLGPVGLDTIWEAAGAGIDTVRSTASHTLGANLENLVLMGGANLNGTGNALANRMVGNTGNNWMNGAAGADTMFGGAGNDIYLTDGLDTIWEAAGAGIDTVRSTANTALGANLENLVLLGTGNLVGTGNALDNVMSGNTGNNWMHGGAGVDRMFGGAGNDTLDGGAGNDLLRGDAGQDRFVFRAGADRVLDFANDVDTIALDDALWGGAPRTAAQLVAAATQVGSSVVFDFGAGNTLTIDNLLNKALLLDDLIVV